MANRAESAKLNWPRWQQALLIALLVVIIGNRMTSLLDATAYRAGLYGEFVYAGGNLINDPAAPPGFGAMVNVVPNGPIARAGVRNGDHVRTDPSYRRLQQLGIARTLKFTLDRDGVRLERQIMYEQVPVGNVRAESNSLRLLGSGPNNRIPNLIGM